MKSITWLLCLFSLALPSLLSFAQSPTSRVIAENAITTLAIGSTQTVAVQLWTAPTGGTLVFSELESNLPKPLGQTVSHEGSSRSRQNGLPEKGGSEKLYLPLLPRCDSLVRATTKPPFFARFPCGTLVMAL